MLRFQAGCRRLTEILQSLDNRVEVAFEEIEGQV